MDPLDAFTSCLAQAHACRWIAAVGLPARPSPSLVRVGFEARSPGGTDAIWSRTDPDAEPQWTPLRTSALADAVVACRLDALGDEQASERLTMVRRALELAPAGVVLFEAVPGPRAEALAAARRILGAHRLAPVFLGCVRRPAHAPERESLLAVLERGGAAMPPTAAPESFRVVAIVPAHDEEDVVAQTLGDLVGQGIDVYLVDNWSTDATVERARPFLGRGLVAIERFPPDGPSRTYDLRALLGRVEAVAERLSWASWVMLHDADERRRSPWRGTTLRDALWHVDRSGFSCVDHVTLNFWPTDDAFDPAGRELEEHFRHFEFSDHPGHFHQRRAWKQLGQRVALAESAGHDVAFAGRRVYPYRFLLKHYPIRSRAQGERKLRDRSDRWNAQERALGWHRQYDALSPDDLVREPSSLRWFDPASFDEEFLIERLSAAGVFEVPPQWATPPRW